MSPSLRNGPTVHHSWFTTDRRPMCSKHSRAGAMGWRCQNCRRADRRILHRNKNPLGHLRIAPPQSSFPSHVEGCTSVRVFSRRAATRQIASLIKDCENTMVILNQILESLSASSGNVFRRPCRQFRESLVSGDIARLRQRIQLFNSTLTLPLQMITV